MEISLALTHDRTSSRCFVGMQNSLAEEKDRKK